MIYLSRLNFKTEILILRVSYQLMILSKKVSYETFEFKLSS